MDIEQLKQEASVHLATVNSPQAMEEFRLKYLGKKGIVADIFEKLATAEASQKGLIGKTANDLRVFVTQLIEGKAGLSVQATVKLKDTIDLSLPGVRSALGHQHILTQTIDEILDIFKGLGFVVVETSEIETEFHNFTGLNIPLNHPSRDGFDTFYLNAPDPSDKGKKLLLRSHTSPGQVRIMKAHKPPMAVIVPGRVYRPDAVDASHSFMFHQIEGLLVDDDISFAHLKGLLTEFCQRFFGPTVKMRFRPHFFPFTEPSAEVDIDAEALGIKNKKWLEILGCGMVNPNVFKAVGYPDGRYTGIAFGMGVERMAMLRHGISDIRLFYENDVRFLKQF